MGFVALEKLHRLQEGYKKAFRVGNQELLLIHTNGKTHLIHSRCPHAEYSLANGTVAEGQIRCPQHGICFDLTTGQPQGGEAVDCVAGLTHYALEYDENQVGVIVPD